MDFYEQLEAHNLLSLLQPVEYQPPVFHNWDRVRESLTDIVQNNRKVLVYGDYDVDGLMCALVMRDGLQGLGCTNLSVYNYQLRTHSLDRSAVNMCIQGHYEYMIVCDTGCSDLGLLQQLNRYGIKVVVLDHHNTALNYSDFVGEIAVINTVLENRMLQRDLYAYSAGALCFIVMDLLYREFDKSCEPLSIYGTVSLFSDCMDMKNELNRAVYYKSRKVAREAIPTPVGSFMRSAQAFNARFISFWFAPKINALFRSENFGVLNSYFFDSAITPVVRAKYLEIIDAFHAESREFVQKVSDVVEYKQLDHFVLCDLESAHPFIKEDKFSQISNYTGLIANSLSDRFSKTAVVYAKTQSHVKGSVRDIYGRNYLQIFQQLCEAGGHNAAFGFKVRLLDLNDFLYSVSRVDKYHSIEMIANKPFVVEYPYQDVDSALIEDMANYNEFAGTNVPVALLRKQIIGDMREYKGKFYYQHTWGQYTLQSNYSIPFGSYVLLRPFKSGSTKLQIQ